MKVIGSDFDGTITTNKVILDSTRKAIKKFRDNGNVFVIVTGRSVPKFKEGIEKYNIDFFDYVICANGSIVLDENLNCIEKNIMNHCSVENILNTLLDGKNKQIILNTENKSYKIYQKNDYLRINDPILSISLVFDTIEDRRSYHLEESNDISVFSNNMFTDILAAGASKATAILGLFSKLNGDNLYTIGDGENDICMLEIAENSYTFKNSVEIVKRSAKEVCQSIDEILEIINND